MLFYRITYFAFALFITTLCTAEEVQPSFDWTRWRLNTGVEMLFFDAHRETDTPAALGLRLSYRLSEAWSLDSGISYVPYHYGTSSDGGLCGSVDMRYHFTRATRFDPYIACGAGFYAGDEQFAGPRAGLGFLYHITEQIALFADTRATLSVEDSAMLYQAGVGLSFRFGSEADNANVQAAGIQGKPDHDRDGLPDDDEATSGTDPFNPDSDRDGLKDGEEALVWKTDPLNPDSDFDTLKDGEEVRTWKTDPLKRDSDGGCVDDGHEVLIDKTHPSVPTDDLFLVVIPASIGYTLTPFTSEVMDALSQVGNLLTANPRATALIEAHTDRQRRMDEKSAVALTEQCAKQAMECLLVKGIAPNRLHVKGYGYSRPKVQHNLVRGNPENRRLEVYISGMAPATAQPKP